MNKRDRIYWFGVGAVAVGLICAYIFWVAPIRRRVADERDSFRFQRDKVEQLELARSIIPSEEAIEPVRDYTQWLENELQTRVANFFAASRETLNSPIVADAGNSVSQSRFKAEYQKRRDDLMNRFPREWASSRRLFPDYGWLGEGLPRERDYNNITQDYNIRKELLEMLMGVGALNVERIEVNIDNRRQGDLCDYIPVRLTAAVPADRLDRAINGLTNVSRRDGRQSLCVIIRRMTVSQASGEAAQVAVNIDLEMDVLDFPADFDAQAGL